MAFCINFNRVNVSKGRDAVTMRGDIYIDTAKGYQRKKEKERTYFIFTLSNVLEAITFFVKVV